MNIKKALEGFVASTELVFTSTSKCLVCGDAIPEALYDNHLANRHPDFGFWKESRFKDLEKAKRKEQDIRIDQGIEDLN